MSASEFWATVEKIRAGDGRYAREAYAFVMESLDVTVRACGERRHVSAGELLTGAWGYAKHRYGLMALTVLESWGVRSGGDVGEIVFQLIDAGVLSKRAEDARADFDQATDLRNILEEEYFRPGD